MKEQETTKRLDSGHVINLDCGIENDAPINMYGVKPPVANYW
jgi:hypothetical protein